MNLEKLNKKNKGLFETNSWTNKGVLFNQNYINGGW